MGLLILKDFIRTNFNNVEWVVRSHLSRTYLFSNYILNFIFQNYLFFQMLMFGRLQWFYRYDLNVRLFQIGSLN